MEGWIKLHRRLIDWEWFQDSKTLHLFVYLLLHANHEQNKWRGIEIKKGQMITSLAHLSEATGLSVQSIRTSLNKLKSTGELTNNSTNKYRLIEMLNWGEYQCTNKLPNKPVTNKQQASNKQTTTNKNVKNERMKETNIYSSSFNSFWNGYPIKVGKRKAFSIWRQRGLAKYLPEMLEFIKSAVKTKQWSDGFIPHPSTFLNGNRWEDDLDSLGKQREAVSVK